jgi:hypothetical protein
MSEKKAAARYLCKKCGIGFSNNQTLQKHLSDKKVHANNAAESSAPKKSVTTSKTGTASKAATGTAACKPCQQAQKNSNGSRK